MKGRVGYSKGAGVVGKWGMNGVNKNYEYLVDTWTDR